MSDLDLPSENVPSDDSIQKAESKEKVEKNSSDHGKKSKAKKTKGNSAGVCLRDVPEPEFWKIREEIFDALFASQEDERNRRAEENTPIEIVLPNGTTVHGIAFKTTPFDIARSISKSLSERVVVALLDGETEWDVSVPLEKSCRIEFFDFESDRGKHVFWHSSAHVLGLALERVYGCRLSSGPPLKEGGFFYDAFMGDQVVREEEYPLIEAAVEDLVKAKKPFQRLLIAKDDALEMFRYNPLKVELLATKVPDGGYCTIYRCGSLIDPCRGPHLPNTGRVKAFAVLKNSSSYYKGDKDRESLQRVYGISFPTAKELEEFLERRKLAMERDHRKIGLDQQLFFFHTFSPGSCFFLPHGARIYNKLMEFVRKEYRKRGFEEVMTPNMFDVRLWETSGHWAKYQENMFSFDVEKEKFALKPMNCPSHCLMFGHRIRSFRELPIRYADFGVLHRNEYSGALSGLTRVRRFQQDDAHIFCAPSQIMQEMEGAFDFMSFVYSRFGFDFELELSTRPENFIGDIEKWNDAEAQLAEALNRFGHPWQLNPGDGAFYGPKIDIKVSDALHRKHQCATIQLDFQLPERFELEFMAEGGGYDRPVLIHRAIYGSFERFIAIITENCGGRWPFWLSPRQCIVVPVSMKHADYAVEVRQQIFQAGYECEIDLSNRTLQKKIFEGQTCQFNYILVVGDREVENKTINVRTRDNEVHGERTVEQLLVEFAELIDRYE